ncbi:major capsid protein [Caudoviricetes sp.]|nr:major capsid protein [Caudoviricetes sp.]UOF81089.1 major capsid protein [Caudoviricetes sp.]UOF82208.1 major capsid protein [Caudoviricetes sp.]UOF82434.1 major capsid protein [Caudoviricetes sp.]UOF82605.1 major capsid protein [Caudoviricetes sp.]
MVQTTSNLTNSLRTAYGAVYLEAAARERVYDQFSQPVAQQGVEDAARLSATVQVPFLSSMRPTTSTISQTADITPQILRDATASISPTSRGDAIQWAEPLDVQVYTNYGESRTRIVGESAMEVIDGLAMDAALQGSAVLRAAARASLDAGTSTHRLTDSAVAEVDTFFTTLKVPAYIMPNGAKRWAAVMPAEAYHDLRTGGNVIAAAQYQDKEIILNMELGMIGPFKILRSPFAKVFAGQGAANASAVATTLNGAVNALATSIIVASGTNISSGKWLHILETAETANTHTLLNERVKYVSGTTTVVIMGQGENGGLRFDHASGLSVTNADSVYPVFYGGPFSLACLFDSVTGRYGKVVGPKVDGILDQFTTLGYKYYGGYGRWVEPWCARGEYASSLDA